MEFTGQPGTFFRNIRHRSSTHNAADDGVITGSIATRVEMGKRHLNAGEFFWMVGPLTRGATGRFTNGPNNAYTGATALNLPSVNRYLREGEGRMLLRGKVSYAAFCKVVREGGFAVTAPTETEVQSGLPCGIAAFYKGRHVGATSLWTSKARDGARLAFMYKRVIHVAEERRELGAPIRPGDAPYTEDDIVWQIFPVVYYGQRDYSPLYTTELGEADEENPVCYGQLNTVAVLDVYNLDGNKPQHDAHLKRYLESDTGDMVESRLTHGRLCNVALAPVQPR